MLIEPRLLKRHKTAVMAFLGLLLLLGISSGLYCWIAGTSSNAAQPEVVKIQTVRVKTASMPVSLDTVGSLFSLHEAKLKAPMPGYVSKILVESGSWVKKGTQLIQIVGGAEVMAPFDGYLTDWKVKVGEHIPRDAELIDIVDTTELSLHYRVPENYASQLDIGQTVLLNQQATSDRSLSTHSVKAAVTYIAPVIDRKTHTILVHARVQNAEHDLWPGMSAHVRHIFSEAPDALVLPESSLILSMEGYEILVIEQGKLVRRTVTLGVRNQGRVQILSGVHLGESVLLTRTDVAKEGIAVTPEDWPGEW